jgi:aminopeptidase N
MSAEHEARRRPVALPAATARYGPDRPAKVDHIALDLSFDFKRKILHGRCSTTFTALATKVAYFGLHAAQLTILKVTDPSGKRLPFEHDGAKLGITLGRTLPVGSSATVVIQYEARQPRQGIYFVGPDEAYPKKPLQVWTQGQDEDAHYWFPCIDYPNAKATTEVKATVPAGFFVLSNGALVKTTSNARAKTKTYHWKMDVPHVTYLVSCVAGKFSGHTDDVDGTPVSYYVHPGRKRRRAVVRQGAEDAALSASVWTTSTRTRNTRDASAISSSAAWGTPLRRRRPTRRSRRAGASRFLERPAVAHELAHQWFGDP